MLALVQTCEALKIVNGLQSICKTALIPINVRKFQPTLAVVEADIKHVLIREVGGIMTSLTAPLLNHGLSVGQVAVP